MFGAPAYAADASIVFDGRYEYRTDEISLQMLGNQVCFFPTAPSSLSVPRPPGDDRSPWFCFENSERAGIMLGFALNKPSKKCGIRGKAKVRVIGYKRYAGEGDDNDVATLMAVLRKSEPEDLPCSE